MTLVEGDIDRQIDIILKTPDETRWEIWKSAQFPQIFPQMVQRIFSGQGIKRYAEGQRHQMFDATVNAFSKLPWSDTRDGTDNFIHLSGMGFTKDGTVAVRSAKTLSSDHYTTLDSLVRVNVASALLLGMSLEDEELAMMQMINLCREDHGGNVIRTPFDIQFRSNLERLMLTENVTREWIKAHHLDTFAGVDWDLRATEVYLNMPAVIIDAERKFPMILPRAIRTDLKFYPSQTVSIFVDYILTYISALSPLGTRVLHLRDFLNSFYKLPPNFDEATWLEVRLITEIIEGNRELQKRLLEKGPRLPERFRWLSKT